MRDLLSRDLLLGKLFDLIISLLLIAWVDHQPGTLQFEIKLPPLFPPQYFA